MNIIGKVKVSRKDFENGTAYSTNIVNKNIEGASKRMYITVQLPKGVSLNDKTIIDVKKGFLSFYIDSKGYEKLKAVVMEFDEVDDVADDITEEIMSMDSDELPF